MNNPDHCTLLRDTQLKRELSLPPAALRALETLQFHGQTYRFVEVTGALRLADSRLQIPAQVLLFTTPVQARKP